MALNCHIFLRIAVLKEERVGADWVMEVFSSDSGEEVRRAVASYLRISLTIFPTGSRVGESG